MIVDVRIHPDAMKYLDGLDKRVRERILNKLRSLKGRDITFLSGLDLKKMKGTKKRKDLLRLRIGEYRIMFDIEDDIIWVTEIISRGNDYQGY
jgi:mRNA interferase RelE/StbE